jgi:hypothetical protein
VAVGANGSVIPNTVGPKGFELNARVSPKSAARDGNNKEKDRAGEPTKADDPEKTIVLEGTGLSDGGAVADRMGLRDTEAEYVGQRRVVIDSIACEFAIVQPTVPETIFAIG